MPAATTSTPVLDLYRDLATGYDASTQRFDDTRRAVVAALRLRPGDTVLDVGCGTGRCFGFVQGAIGPAGRLIGADRSPEMLARTRERCDRHGWANVELVEGPADDVVIPPGVQAVLLCATHDILRSPPGPRPPPRPGRAGHPRRRRRGQAPATPAGRAGPVRARAAPALRQLLRGLRRAVDPPRRPPPRLRRPPRLGGDGIHRHRAGPVGPERTHPPPRRRPAVVRTSTLTCESFTLGVRGGTSGYERVQLPSGRIGGGRP